MRSRRCRSPPGASQRRVERDPLAVDPYRGLATALWFGGRSAGAEAVYRRLFAFSPNAKSMHYRLSLVLRGAGRAEEVLNELAAEPSPWWQAIARVMAYDALGRRAETDLKCDPMLSV